MSLTRIEDVVRVYARVLAEISRILTVYGYDIRYLQIGPHVRGVRCA